MIPSPDDSLTEKVMLSLCIVRCISPDLVSGSSIKFLFVEGPPRFILYITKNDNEGIAP